MRYLNIENTEFDGRQIKLEREFEDLQSAFRISVSDNDFLDQIALRNEVDLGYTEAYRLFDLNRVRIIDNGLTLRGLDFVDIPL